MKEKDFDMVMRLHRQNTTLIEEITNDLTDIIKKQQAQIDSLIKKLEFEHETIGHDKVTYDKIIVTHKITP